MSAAYHVNTNHLLCSVPLCMWPTILCVPPPYLSAAYITATSGKHVWWYVQRMIRPISKVLTGH